MNDLDGTDSLEAWRVGRKCAFKREQHFTLKTMLMKEYRICMPLSVEEVRHISLELATKASPYFFLDWYS